MHQHKEKQKSKKPAPAQTDKKMSGQQQPANPANMQNRSHPNKNQGMGMDPDMRDSMGSGKRQDDN